MNEKGLVIELMWLNDSRYPDKDERPSLSVLQWIQFQLDQASTVDEVIASDKKVRIFSTGTPQHYLVADRSGEVATVEFIEGKMTVHRQQTLPYPVLANSTYAASLDARNRKRNNDNSLQRFNIACKMVKAFEEQPANVPMVDYAFTVLDAVSQGDFTKWSIVYDIDNLQIHFKTASLPKRKSLSFSAFAFDCNSK